MTRTIAFIVIAVPTIVGLLAFIAIPIAGALYAYGR
jgi:hypothetical protein